MEYLYTWECIKVWKGTSLGEMCRSFGDMALGSLQYLHKLYQVDYRREFNCVLVTGSARRRYAGVGYAQLIP